MIICLLALALLLTIHARATMSGSQDIIGSARLLGLGVDRGAVERNWNIIVQDSVEAVP